MTTTDPEGITMTDPDLHQFTASAEDERECAVCGDDEGANDHQDPADHARVWMDVEGLTLADVDALDALTAAIAPEFEGNTLPAAQKVADWIGGFDGEANRYAEERSALLADREGSLAGLRAFMDDTEAEEHDQASCLFCQAGETQAHTYESDNGNAQAMPTVEEYVNLHGITLTVTSELGYRVEEFPGERPWEHYAYRVTLRRPGAPRAWSHIMWRQGTGITREPQAAEVFDSLLRDGAYAEYTTDSFADWADELGFDADSFRARTIYGKCRRAWERMSEFLGGEDEAIRVFTKYESL